MAASSIFRLEKLGFLGAGNLSECLLKGFIASGVIQLNQLWASGPRQQGIRWVKQLGCNTTNCNVELVKKNRTVVLGVKPLMLPKVLKEIAPHVTADHILLSFAAGMKLETMEGLLPVGTRLVRLMCNTPVQFMEGVSSFSLGRYCSPLDRQLVYKLMRSVGHCEEVKEDLMDVITGFAGGGPAYAYTFIEAIADGAVKGGMSREQALVMTTRSVLGAARMLLETKRHPGSLRDAVCSAGGSTIYGVHALEKAGMRGAVIDAVEASSNRSRKLGEILNKAALEVDQ